MLRDTVRAFCAREVQPHVKDWDKAECFPAETLAALAELGLLGISVPEQYGGAGMDHLAYALCVEEIARVDGALALMVASHNGHAPAHLLAVGTEEQKVKYLPRAASGEWLTAWAMTEPDAGSDMLAIRTTAVRDGDGWVLNGDKTFVSQGSVCAFCVVFAQTEDERTRRGLTAFIVERCTPGFEVRRTIDKCGCRASDTAELSLVRCRVADSARLGGINAAFFDTMRILDRGRLAIAAMALGLGRGATELALRYALDRETFGQPIARHQAIQWKLADAKTQLDAAELLVHRAAWLADRGLPFSMEASMAKLFASETAAKVCSDAVQIHGGYGYSREFSVERFFRDAKLCEICEGTSEIQRLIIARHLLGQRRLPL